MNIADQIAELEHELAVAQMNVLRAEARIRDLKRKRDFPIDAEALDKVYREERHFGGHVTDDEAAIGAVIAVARYITEGMLGERAIDAAVAATTDASRSSCVKIVSAAIEAALSLPKEKEAEAEPHRLFGKVPPVSESLKEALAEAKPRVVEVGDRVVFRSRGKLDRGRVSFVTPGMEASVTFDSGGYGSIGLNADGSIDLPSGYAHDDSPPEPAKPPKRIVQVGDTIHAPDGSVVVTSFDTHRSGRRACTNTGVFFYLNTDGTLAGDFHVEPAKPATECPVDESVLECWRTGDESGYTDDDDRMRKAIAWLIDHEINQTVLRDAILKALEGT